MADDVGSPTRDPRLIVADLVWDTPGRAEVKATVAALLRYMDSSWRTFTSVPRLADLAGLDVKTVRDRLDLLVQAGGVSRRDRYNDKGGMMSPEWTLFPRNIATAITVASSARAKRDAPVRRSPPLPSTDEGGGYRTREGGPTVYGGGALPSTEGPPLPSTDDDPGILIRGSDPEIRSGEIAMAEDPTPKADPDPRSTVEDRSTDTENTDAEEDSMQLFEREIPIDSSNATAEEIAIPSWTPKDTRPYDRADVAAMVLTVIAEVRRPANLDPAAPTPPVPADVKCKGDAKTILALWSYLERPPIGDFARDLLAVVRAARSCPHRLFARDIRAEGWEGGDDRHRDLTTLCRRDRWQRRLEVARAWTEHPERYAATSSHAPANRQPDTRPTLSFFR